MGIENWKTSVSFSTRGIVHILLITSLETDHLMKKYQICILHILYFFIKQMLKMVDCSIVGMC